MNLSSIQNDRLHTLLGSVPEHALGMCQGTYIICVPEHTLGTFQVKLLSDGGWGLHCTPRDPKVLSGILKVILVTLQQ